MRISITFALMLMLLASNACAFGGSGSVVVDIVGSRADNTRIAACGAENVELEIVGSTANNTIIAPPERRKAICHECPCPDKKRRCPEDKKPWDKMHLGVDAWYGTFWYTDINMPQWPVI